ncbi:hypothetical protein ACLI4U_11165 [Natrialbaceae archaeon A-CW2]|uniref:hypothetical protein n=1 Tax=Natronosalvus amylolyticus TaxID=2961994 RepID=UPI0020CA0512|nr:hypothetical protein [Natronosalvus amylolyticus]
MILTLSMGFLIVVIGTYIGAKLALRSFFGRDFVDPETGEFTLPESSFDDSVGEKGR